MIFGEKYSIDVVDKRVDENRCQSDTRGEKSNLSLLKIFPLPISLSEYLFCGISVFSANDIIP